MSFFDKLFLSLAESHEDFGKRIGAKDITWPQAMPIIAASIMCLAMMIWAACQ